jgi:hypothetical protein
VCLNINKRSSYFAIKLDASLTLTVQLIIVKKSLYGKIDIQSSKQQPKLF